MSLDTPSLAAPACGTHRPVLSAADLDAVYSDFCHTMTRVGQEQAPLFMARFALLAMVELGDRGLLQHMVQDAAAELA